ncbi:MAG: precorrin-3B C(17)-methyltransferase [Dehalococcoidia bacterium]|nr:MAG: precorrin-3B C(17)-methyltransferase [Dehalococcoidia bacterium]
MNGKIYLVGIGPGNRDDVTPRAAKVLKNVQVIIGHKSCLDQLWKLVIGKEVVAGEMTPVERAGVALEKAQEGNDVAVVSSGDIGIYAFASTFFSHLKERDLEMDVEVVPGVTVASAAAALLGSPLGHDLAIISLADQATTWQNIKRRLISAAEADFVVVLYNPVGKVGSGRIKEAIKILMEYRESITPVGIVTGATTEQEQVLITTLGQVSVDTIETDTIVIVGNSETYIYNGRMITPREYIQGLGY